MTVRSVDIDNDWNFGRGRNDYKRETASLKQRLKTRLQSHLGDCFFRQTAGIDWLNLLGGKNREELAFSISVTILNTTDVIRLRDFNMTLDENRHMTITYEIDTVFGAFSDVFTTDLGVL